MPADNASPQEAETVIGVQTSLAHIVKGRLKKKGLCSGEHRPSVCEIVSSVASGTGGKVKTMK